MSAIMRAAPFAAVALLAGCPLAELDVDVPQTCVTDTGVQVPGGLPMFPAQSFTFDQLGELGSLASQGFALTLVSGQVQATSGITYLGFVEQATMSLAMGSGSGSGSGQGSAALPMIDAFDCGPCAATGPTLSLTPSSDMDLAPYVASGSVVVGVDLVGQLPSVAWSLDVEVCVAVSGSKQVAD
jgi:hypothetical protein